MSDLTQDPYAGATSDEERQAIYQKLLAQYEESEYERRKTIYTDLMENWQHHRAIQQDFDQRSQKFLLTLAAGSFGVSFAFISQIVKLESAVNLPILVLSWAFFALTIVLAILELKIGSVIQDKLLDDVEKNIERGYKGEPYINSKKWFVFWPGRILSWASYFTFIAGVVCLLYFVHQNI